MSSNHRELPLPAKFKAGMAHRPALLLAVVIMSVGMLSGQVLAIEACPAEVKPENPRVTHSHNGEHHPPGEGIPLDTLVSDLNWNADKSAMWQYRMPLGYRTGWTRTNRAEDFDINAVHGNLDFTFWMPDKRYAERRMNFPMGSDPKVCEHGRPPPGEDDYLIRFSFGAISRFTIMETPEKVWGGVYLPRGATRYGLIKSKPSVNDNSKIIIKIHQEDYYHPIGHPYQVHVGCSNYSRSTCTGNLYFPEEKLSLFIRFGRQYMPIWQKNVIAALELLKSWQAETPETLSDSEIDKIILKVRGDSNE